VLRQLASFAQAALAVLACTTAARAQVPDEVREALQRSSVATLRDQVWAMAAGPQRGTPAASEEFYATVALRAMAMHLCGLEPAPGRALEAAIESWRRVAVTQRGRDFEVVLQAPLQKPTCRVTLVPVVPAPALLPPAAPAPAAASSETPARPSDITVRTYGIER